MKITMISILEKVRAPSRIEFRRGLELGDGARLSTSRRLPAEEVIPASDDEEQADTRHHDVSDLVAVVLSETASDQMTDDETCTKHCEIHDFPPQGTGFSTALLPQRLSVSCDSDNTANIAYMSLKVKLNRKSPYFRAFSRFLYWINFFSSPKMRNREFVFTPKIEYELVAERSEANQNSLTFPTWCPREESNLYHDFRKVVSYPLSYGGINQDGICKEI